jgi:hypothetical protein
MTLSSSSLWRFLCKFLVVILMSSFFFALPSPGIRNPSQPGKDSATFSANDSWNDYLESFLMFAFSSFVNL